MKNVFFISKKIIPSFILIATVFSFAPNTALAFVDNIIYDDLCGVVGEKKQLEQIKEGSVGQGFINIITGQNNIPCFKYMLAFTVAWLGNGVVSLGEYAANSSNSLFKTTLNKLTSDAYTITKPSKTFGDAIVNIHELVREWANILIVLGFIGVALAFIFNLDQYKKLLVPMLIVALLINFIGVFVGLVIDVANIIMGQFVAGIGQSGNIVYKISESWNKTLHKININSIEQAFIYLGLSCGLAFAYLLIAVTFLALSVIFIERFAILAILFVLSPLAFVFYVFPLAKAKDLFKSWWEHFLKWSFVGLIGIFFIYLAANVAVALGNIFNFKEVTDFKNVSDVYGELFFYLFITIVFLIIGMRITFKASGWASGIVIGAAVASGTFLAAKGASLAGKAGLGTAKVAGRVTGVTPAAQAVGEGARTAGRWVRRGVNRLFPTFTGMKPGEAGRRDQERDAADLNDKNRTDRVENMSAQQRAEVLRSNRFGRSARFDRAVIYKKMHQDGQLDMLSQGEQVQFAQEAMRSGVGSQDAITKMRGSTQAHIIQNRLFDPQTRARIFKSMADKNELSLLSMTDQINSLTEAAANGVRAPEIAGKMTSESQAEIINQQLFDPETRGKIAESLIKKGGFGFIQGANPAATRTLQQSAIREATNAGAEMGDLEKADWRMAGYNRDRLMKLGASPAVIEAGLAPGATPAALVALVGYQNSAEEQVVNERIGSMKGDELRTLNPNHLYDSLKLPFNPANGATHNGADYRRVKGMKPEQIREYQFDPDPDRRQALKDQLPEIDHNYVNHMTQAATARGVGDQAIATHHTNEALKLEALYRAIYNLP